MSAVIQVADRIIVARNFPEAMPAFIPDHVKSIVEAVRKNFQKSVFITSELDQVIVVRFTGFQSLRTHLVGKHDKGLSVVLSEVINPEETQVVVFEDLSKPLGRDTVTRHYQPSHYFGKKTEQDLADHINNLKTKAILQRRSDESLNKHLDDINKGIGVNYLNSEIYQTEITRRDISLLSNDIYNYLLNGIYQ